MTTTQDRVRQLIEYKGLTVNAFENLCGLANGTVSKMGQGTRRGTFDKIFRTFPNVNRDWLLYGEGDMIPGEKNTKQGIYIKPAEPTSMPSDMFDKLMAAIGDIKVKQEKCEEMLEKAYGLVDNATTIMNNAIQLNSDMKLDHQQTKELYDEIHKVQEEHIAKSREWIEGSIANIKNLRNDIRMMIDNQTAETERNAKENLRVITTTCKSADVADIRKGVNTLLTYHKLPLGATPTSMMPE